ncbi:MAG TPA: alpha-amylase family protein, partial [Chthoniobacteraceae bacterium]|nr:alpha-amylase family protein [Chthoniobacteraceae bacterium]
NPITLQKFRDWLKTQYASLDALNAEWDTKFAAWNDVKPFTTDQIKNRMASGDAIPRGNPDWQAVERIKFDPVQARKEPMKWNLAPWCDFRTYMDISLSGALDDIRKSAHQLDPRTPVGIEGEQAASAFGGHDLWRLSQAVDWVEPYDIGNAREIFGSFMPGKPIVTTVGESDANHAARRLWHLLLEGDKGCIVWWSEDCIDWKSDDYALTPKGQALAPVLKEMTSPLAALFLRAKPVTDPIAIHYSQASIQVDWLIESTGDGSTWLRRFSSYESSHNRVMKVRDGWLKALQDLGYTPQFVSSEQIEQGALGKFRALVLPDSYALSERENAAIEKFTAARNTVFEGETPACFDEHGKLIVPPRPWSKNLFEGMMPPPGEDLGNSVLNVGGTGGDLMDFPKVRVDTYALTRLAKQSDFSWPRYIERNITVLHPEVSVPLESRTHIHRYTLGAARLVAFERNVDYHMGEDLKQGGGNETLEMPVDLDAKLDKPAHAYDLRTGKYLGLTSDIKFTLDPWRPSLYALLPQQIPEEKLMDYLAAQ